MNRKETAETLVDQARHAEEGVMERIELLLQAQIELQLHLIELHEKELKE